MATTTLAATLEATLAMTMAVTMATILVLVHRTMAATLAIMARALATSGAVITVMAMAGADVACANDDVTRVSQDGREDVNVENIASYNGVVVVASIKH